MISDQQFRKSYQNQALLKEKLLKIDFMMSSIDVPVYDCDIKAVIFRKENFKGAQPFYAAIACALSGEGGDLVDFVFSKKMIASEGSNLFAYNINKNGDKISLPEIQVKFDVVCKTNWIRHQEFLGVSVPDTLVRNAQPMSYSSFLTNLVGMGLLVKEENLLKVKSWGGCLRIKESSR